MRSTFAAVALFAAGLSLTACGGGDDAFGGPSGADTVGTSLEDIDSVIISYPVSNAIVDSKEGWYQRKASVLLQDKDGRPAADGTRVTLKIIDSVIVKGAVMAAGADSISGSTMHLENAEQTDNTPVLDLTTAFVERPGLSGAPTRSIQVGDTVLLNNQAYYKDVFRKVAAAPDQAYTLTVSSAFTKNYPSYSDVNYLVGASMLSAAVFGEDESGNLLPGEAYVTGGTGTATIWIRYAADIDHLMSGCNPLIDDRIEPVGSGQVYLIVTGGYITTFKEFCFSPISGFKVEANFTSLSGSAGATVSTSICTEDGGDGVGVPFYPISFTKTAGDANATVSLLGTASLGGPYTADNGCFTAQFSNLSGASGDTGTWKFVVGDGSVDVTVTVN